MPIGPSRVLGTPGSRGIPQVFQWAMIRELSSGGSNRNFECEQFYRWSVVLAGALGLLVEVVEVLGLHVALRIRLVANGLRAHRRAD